MSVSVRAAVALVALLLTVGAVVLRLGDFWFAVGCGLIVGNSLGRLAGWVRQHRPAWKPEWLLVIPFVGFAVGLSLLNGFIGYSSLAGLMLLQLDFIAYHARSASKRDQGNQ